MIGEALPYLINAVSMENMLAMLLGVVIGLVVGAIPGLSPPMAIALMIPVSFQMPPDTALILLVSFFKSNPRIVASPLVGGSIELNIEIIVVFPAPFGPNKPHKEPLGIFKSIPSTA